MLLTTKQAADRIGISERRVQFLVRAQNPTKRLPAIKVGRDWMIDENELEQFMLKPRNTGRPIK
jgi:excisionase family DNA binding protein